VLVAAAAAAVGWAQETEDGVQPQRDGNFRLHDVALLHGGYQHQSNEVVVAKHEVAKMVAVQHVRPCAVASRRRDAFHSFLRLPTHAYAWAHWLKEFCCHGHDLSLCDRVQLILQQQALQQVVVPHQLYQRIRSCLDDGHMAVEDSLNLRKQVYQDEVV
jgi:hypothetical protein